MDPTVVNLIVGKIEDLEKSLGQKIDAATEQVKITNGQVKDLKDWRSKVEPVITTIIAGKKHFGGLLLQFTDVLMKGAILWVFVKAIPSLIEIGTKLK